MEELTLAAFDLKEQNITKLTAILEHSKTLETVEARKMLVKVRGIIEKAGKALREEAIKHNKMVMENEKEYIAILKPGEDRLKAIEAEEAQKAIMEERTQKLPWRKEELAKVGAETTDEFLMTLDDTAFTAYKNQCAADKIEREAVESRREQEEKDRKEAEDRRVAEAEQRAKEYADRRVHEVEEKAEREKQEAEAKRIADEKAAAEAEANEKALAEKNQAYQDFLKSNDYNNETDEVKREGNTFTIYRKIATITI